MPEGLLRVQKDWLCPRSPESMFIEAVKKVAEENKRWVPPHGKGELYLRPILFGSSARLGVSPAEEYMFVVFAVPVGPYFKGGMTPISLRVSQNHHRAAPGGSGGVKSNRELCPRDDALQEGEIGRLQRDNLP